MNTNYNMLIHL